MKSGGFYLTELGIDDDKSNIIETKELKEINDNFNLTTDVFQKKDNKLLEKTKHNVLDYLIREETDFANLYKVEDHFKNIMISNTKEFNRFDKLIKRKQEEIDEVQALINKELIDNIDLEKEEMIQIYNTEKEKIKINTATINHDTECYQHIYNKLYRTNVKINKFIFFIFTICV
jgi:hypothetical protein